MDLSARRLVVAGLFILLGGVVLLGVAGCTGDAYVVRTLQIERRGWDTLDVSVQFARRTLLGPAEPATPQRTTLVLFNAAYDTLYAGAGPRIVFDDRKLGDRERLMLEVCGVFGTVTVCEQNAAAASMKLLRVEYQISYPEDSAYERGSYDLRFVVERKHPITGAWETIHRSVRISGYLLAYVGDEDRDAVKVPFSRAQGRFNLTSDPHFKDFRFHLQSRLYDAQEAPVRFDVYAGLNGQPPFRLTTVEMLVREKTEEVRRAEVDHFAEQAGDGLLEALGVREEDRARFVYVAGWTYKAITHTYLIEVEVLWRSGGRFFRRRHWMKALLEVKEDGSAVRLLYLDANEPAARSWERVIRGETLALPALDPYVPDDPADVPPAEAEAAIPSLRQQGGVTTVDGI